MSGSAAGDVPAAAERPFPHPMNGVAVPSDRVVPSRLTIVAPVRWIVDAAASVTRLGRTLRAESVPAHRHTGTRGRGGRCRSVVERPTLEVVEGTDPHPIVGAGSFHGLLPGVVIGRPGVTGRPRRIACDQHPTLDGAAVLLAVVRGRAPRCTRRRRGRARRVPSRATTRPVRATTPRSSVGRSSSTPGANQRHPDVVVHSSMATRTDMTRSRPG